MDLGVLRNTLSAAWLLPAMAFAIAMAATPGPNNVMVAASGATFGFRRTLPHMLGISLGFPLMLLAVAFGAGRLLRDWPWLHEAMRWVGVVYLAWLAWRIAIAPVGRPDAAPRAARPLTFLQAAAFQWVNPKAWIIAAGAIVTYITDGDALLAQALVLAALFVAVCMPCLALWTSVGSGVARVLRTPRALRAFNLAMAGLLIASLVPLVEEGLR
ncbi:MAG: LysE family translocator [Acidisphaera sp.]|nr:LysE family translocator [Acidisphaera sp.]MBV9813023.1 LysE family translocator [Acetobacteraceae bacterium]